MDKNELISLAKMLDSNNIEDAKFALDIMKYQKVSLTMDNMLLRDKDVIKEFTCMKKWHHTSKNPDNIRKRYPNTLDLFIYNLSGNGGFSTLIRWK